MYVRRLQLTHFRNYHQLDLDAAPGRVLILGDNAQGKSNLLEALYLLASGHSARAGKDWEMIARGEETEAQAFTRLVAAVERQDGALQLEALVTGPSIQEAMRGGKRFRVNGIPRRGVDFIGQLRAVLFTADDLDIISGPPAARRAFIDAALSQLDRAYYAALQRYGRIMQQRNASLRRIKEGVGGMDELALWDDGFSREGATLIAARQNALARLGEIASAAHRELSGALTETLAIAYEPQLGEEWKALLPQQASAATVQPLFAAAVAAQRRREIAAGLSLVGPHRDDIGIALNGVAAAAYGSRAQIRTAALALRLAEARLLAGDGDAPVILLDDIVSELDGRRRESVLAGVSGFEQAWFTATTGSWLPPEFVEGSRVFEVRSGEILEVL